MALRNRRRRRRRNRRAAIPRKLVDRGNPLEFMTDDELFTRFRFRGDTIIFIVGLLVHNLQRSSLPALTQVLVTLRFLATGSFYSLIADSYTGISTTSVFRSVRDVCASLSTRIREFVKMPTGADADKTKKQFYKIAGFPNVLGCVDGTLIKIMAPSENEADYISRKGFHSLNIQMISDASFKFINSVIKWPGSVHDSRIFRDSPISVAFENGTYKGFLLGDSGYPCKSYLMTPFLSPGNRAEERFNRSLCRTRVIVEQSFGILKRRFSCLHSGLRTTPQNSCKIISACVILHNIGIDRNDIVNIDPCDTDENDNVQMQVVDECNGASEKNGLLINNTSREIGPMLSHTCSRGFVKYGQAVCHVNGEWSDFGCIKGCVNPPTIKDAALHESDKVWSAGSVLNYICKPPFVQLGRVECRSNLTWTLMQCIAVMRSCSHIKQCNPSYTDGEYWLVPRVFVDKPVKIYCHNMAGPRPPSHYLTLIENNYVNYSDKSCLLQKYHHCQSTRIEKIRIGNIHEMKMYHRDLQDRKFINCTKPCFFIQFESAFGCQESCGRSERRVFVVNTRHTGVKIAPNQVWSYQVNTKLNEPVSIVKIDKGRVIPGKCHQDCHWCYPLGHIVTFSLDRDLVPQISDAVVSVCK